MLLRIMMSTAMLLALPAFAEQTPPPKAAKKTTPKKAESTSAKPAPAAPALTTAQTPAHQEPPRVVYTPNAKLPLPEGAVEVETGLWRHVDKDNMVEFERKTPFGVSKWTKKKGELNASERTALERSLKAASKEQE